MRLSPDRSVRDFLRAETRDAHDAVDDLFSDLAVSERDGYLALLRAHAAVLPPLEAALEAGGVATVIPDWPDRRRSAALHADLRTLGAAPVADFPVTAITCEAALLGVAYVLEGSRLGSCILARRVAAGRDPALTQARRYLLHGAGLPLWPRFLAQLEAAPAARDRPDDLLDAARAAFAAFGAARRS